MKREILLLATPANTGKTTAINSLYEKFINIKHYDLKDKRTQPPDFKAVHTVKDNIVGFASNGDAPEEIAENCKFFKKHKCNICITACRTRGKNLLYDWAMKNAYDISLFDFISCSDNETANENKALMMFSRLQYLLKN